MMSAIYRTVRSFSEGSPVGRTEHDVVLAENKYRLLRFRSPADAAPRGAPVLLVPSLINKWYVLDLLPEQSFTGFLLERGHDVYIVDWGEPGPEDRYLTLDHFVDRYLRRCVRTVQRLSEAKQVHLLGYCLGGTLTTIHAALYPESIASMTVLAAPIGFHDEGLLTQWMNVKGFDVEALADGFGNIPWPLMQAAFYAMKPTLQFNKLRTILRRADSDASWLRVFTAIETWGNDNVSFSGGAYRKYIRDLYIENRLVKGGLSISGREVRLRDITSPLLSVSFAHDHIVPEVSARCLVDLVGSRETVDHVEPGGHVGAVIGKRAREGLWTRISDFYRKHDPKRDGIQPSPDSVSSALSAT